MPTTNATTNTAANDGESKPLVGFAPPHLSAVMSIGAFVGISIFYFPKATTVQPDIFVNRVFPDYMSVEVLLYLRGFFALVCFGGFASGWYTPPVVFKIPYRPQSKVARVPVTLTGWRKQFPFTAWSWNILGISFALSTYVGYRVHQHNYNGNVDTHPKIEPWLAHLALILWEIAAPMTLLIGAVVKYALWPAQLKETGRGDAFMLPRALLQHNANVIMAVTEVALMGGLPVRFSHISISVLYGCSYVIFTWAIMNVWHRQGPAFLYFFMDTTLGSEHTMALYVLLLVLMAFYSLFCGVESLLPFLGSNLVGHVAFAIAICALVCRFRD